MTQRQIEILNEAVAIVAGHYAQKMIVKGIMPTAEELDAAVKANWSQVSQEIANLSIAVEELLAS